MLRRRGSKQAEEEKKEDSTSTSSESQVVTEDNKTSNTCKDSDADSKPPSKQTSLPSIELIDKKARVSTWRCADSCCWFIGYICVVWWIVLVLYNALPSLPQYVSDAITGPLPDPPGIKLAKEGLRAHHPVVFVPGIVTGGLELWEGHPCADVLFRKRIWGGTFGEVYKRPKCWMEHMALDNETGLDPAGIRVRPVSGLVAADYFAPGYFVWAVLIENLARLGYEEKNMYMASYDWRLTFQNNEVRDKALTRLKNTIETLVLANDHNKVVVLPHSMGSLFFLHFMKWVEAPPPMGGGGGPDWCARHIHAIMNIGGPFLGVPKAFAGLFSAEGKDIAVARAIAPHVLDSDVFGLQTLQHIMRVTRTWDACMSMIPKGGNTIWGDADWSPEEGYDCSSRKSVMEEGGNEENSTAIHLDPHGKPLAHYGRLISFGKENAQLPWAIIEERRKETEVPATNVLVRSNVSCGDVWTEYQEMSWKDVQEVAAESVYTAEDLVNVLRKVAPKLMVRGDDNWGYGLADDLSDPKYQHFRHWSNPLETTLPNAPDMEVHCMYGVGLPTERSYIYKMSPTPDTCYIPFRIDTSAEGGIEGCLKGGIQLVDGDETVPVLSAGFMCAKGWRGKTRFNPSNAATYVREYNHARPSNMLIEGRGTQSGSHVDILGNFALIEDILKVAAGWTGDEIGGDRLYSDLPKWADRIKLKL